ncbi:PREDICTED: DCAR_015799 [Prunus dulcis]|uniref:PREDICTED: DCAR_015799 n=1 Tax=Prunus dulcis TaxID=3755 RepID=A0A5E4FJN2_PRUDU|nr:hypothetical protein L3X38_000352 [Prunus dulcis]VVA28012.1 PREDICTED: DCAR_015799 [Prunus dulcis]
MVQLCNCLLALSLCVIALFNFYPSFPYSEEKAYDAEKLFIYSSHDDARGFRFKVIENWDDIVDLCGKDRATGEGAETVADAIEVMTPTNEADRVDLDGDAQDLEDIHVIDDISPTSTNGQKRRNRASNSYDILPTKKRGAIKDVIADSIARMTLSFEEFIHSDTKNLDLAEVYA